MDSRTSGGGGSREWTVEQVGEGAAGSGQYNKWGRGQQGVDSITCTSGGGGSRKWTLEQVGERAAGSGQ